MKNWQELSSKEDNEEAANLFINSIKVLHAFDEDLLNYLREELVNADAASVYANLQDPPSLEGLAVFFGNAQSWVDELILENFQNAVKNATTATKSISISPPSFEGMPQSYAAMILTLLDVMAGCSKMGMGSDESIGIVPGAKDFSEAVFKDVNTFPYIKMLNQISKPRRDQHLLLPFMFAYSVLLNNKAREDILKIQGAISVLAQFPSKIVDFSNILEISYGNCLTEASCICKQAYLDFFAANDNLENFANTIPEATQNAMAFVSNEARQTIQNRIDTGVAEHRQSAIQWSNSPWWRSHSRESTASFATVMTNNSNNQNLLFSSPTSESSPKNKKISNNNIESAFGPFKIKKQASKR